MFKTPRNVVTFVFMFSFICLWLSLSFGANGISAIPVFLEPVVAYLEPQKHWREFLINSCGVFEACGCMSGATKAFGANGISAISAFWKPVAAYLGPQKHWRECSGRWTSHKSSGPSVCFFQGPTNF